MLILVVFLAIYRLFQDYVLNPYLMSAGVEMHPMLVLFGVLAGEELLGVPGMFFSVPVDGGAAVDLIRLRRRQLRLAAWSRDLLAGSVAAPLWAHVVSMSTGELRVDGPTAVYELRMPMYEIAHVANPETLMDHIRFNGAHRISSKCHEEDGTYVCVANYEFSGLIDRVEVECTFYQVTVPNHVHLLHAVQGSNADQAVFDQTFPRAEIRFRPPSRLEILSREMLAGLWRAIVSPAAHLPAGPDGGGAIGARRRVAGGDVSGGQWMMRPIAPTNSVSVFAAIHGSGHGADGGVPGARDPDAAAGPESDGPWCWCWDLFHGLYFAAFPATYLAGAQVFEAARSRYYSQSP